ncbi:MAG: CoA-binding protein, partial [Candidatus Bathyarchaeia archaeon]
MSLKSAISNKEKNRSILEKFLRPDSVAVIGASRTPGAVGHEIVRNLINSGYRGRIYPVNPKADELLGLKCYKRIGEVGEVPDLVVISVPANIVPQVVEEAGESGVKCLIVISAGFREVGPDGAVREMELINICRKYGMRMLGPNCLGLINTSTPINASFAKQRPTKGGIAFLSQSGALGTAILDWIEKEKIGFSNFISLGNMADTDETDFIELLGDDRDTKVILVYLEGVKNGKRFLEVAPKVSKIKPIVVFKAGTSVAGARAAASHTGSIAGNKVAYEAAFRRSGVLTVDSLEDLFNLGLMFSFQPTPKGGSIAILTNAGGPSIVASDAASRYNLNLAWLSPSTIEKLRSNLPTESSWINPVDVLGDATADRYAFALETLLTDESVNATIIILTPQAMTQPLETAKKIIEIHSRFPDKPLLPVFMGG